MTEHPRASTQLPRVIGRYLLVEELGAGGMGAVYHALQLTRLSGVDRFCVAKLALPQAAGSSSLLQRFVHEARTSLLLHHRALCATFDVDVDDQHILIAMEQIAGRDVRAIFLAGSQESNPGVRRPPSLTAEEAIALVCEALEGIEYAHTFVDPRTGERLDLVHRDLSPQNLMVSFAGEVKVIDFGIALSRLRREQTAIGTVVGKIRYMAPEQVRGEAVDRRADVFAMAVVLTELLSGARFWGPGDMATVTRRLQTNDTLSSAALESVPPRYLPVLKRALAPAPRDRFGSAAAFREALLAAHGAPLREGALKRAIARLFPDAEAESRAHIRELYQAAQKARAADGPFAAMETQSLLAPVTVEETGAASDWNQTRPEVHALQVPPHTGGTAEVSGVPREPTGETAGDALAPQPTLVAAAPPRAQRRPIAAASAAVSVVALAALGALFALWPGPSTTTAVDAGSVGAPALADSGPAALAPTDAGVPSLMNDVDPPVVDAGMNVAAAVDAGEPRARKPRVLPPAPRHFGDRLRYLKSWCSALTCARDTNERGRDVSKLTLEQIRVLTADVERCLKQCGAH